VGYTFLNLNAGPSSDNGARLSALFATCSKVREKSKWRVQNKLRSETAGVRPCRYWGLPGYRYHWRVERPHQPDRRRM
jgi:hypothetical protein